MLILVRHGRTALNLGHKLQGRIDQPLDEVGQRQAVEIAKVLTDIDRVISSPLMRARQTAAALGKPVDIDQRFVELDYGSFDGLLQSDVPGETWRKWRDDINFRPPNGETLAELDLRVRQAINELVEDARTKNIVVVSHVSPIKSIVAWSLGSDVGASWRMLLDRASISRVAITDLGPVMRGFNDTSHLTEI